MGAKRAVQGRSRPYDELLLEWNRLNNPNFVEPVKRESKAERKERKEKEKIEKKRQAQEAAAAAGIDPNSKKAPGVGGTGTKKGKKGAAAAAGAGVSNIPSKLGRIEVHEEEDIDSEAEVESLAHAVRLAEDRGILGVPLAVPCDASSWFVGRRERVRTCRDLLLNALMPPRTGVAASGPGRLL